MDIYKIIDEGIYKGASDIHIAHNEYIHFRINGELHRTEYYLETSQVEELKGQVLNSSENSQLYNYKNIDKAIDYKNTRLRMHLFKENLGYSLAIRIIPRKIPSFENLNLPRNISKFIEFNSGLVLITGSTGSGKTTTMASLIESINIARKKHIVTIEDPIEYVYKSKNSLIQQREVGRDVLNFNMGVSSVVRQDPDIIVLGELRDLDSIRSALSLGEIGHLVLGTLHSRSAIDTVARIVDIFPKEEKAEVRIQLANSLRAVIHQELIVSGSKRYPICEIMVINKAIRNIIRENENLNSILDQMRLNSKSLGSITSIESIINLLKLGKIKVEDLEGIVEAEDYKKINLIF